MDFGQKVGLIPFVVENLMNGFTGSSFKTT
jgi:hypothetical protein